MDALVDMAGVEMALIKDRVIRIVFDLTALLPQETGVDRYLIELVTHLGKIDQSNQYRIYINWEDRHRFDGQLPGNFQVLVCSRRARLVRLFFQQVLLPILAMWWGADVVHSPSFIIPMMRGRQRHVLTVHDMTSFTLPGCHTRLHDSSASRQLVLCSIRRAHLVIVPSASTQKDIYHWLPAISRTKVRVIPHGIGEEFKIYPREFFENYLGSFGYA